MPFRATGRLLFLRKVRSPSRGPNQEAECPEKDRRRTPGGASSREPRRRKIPDPGRARRRRDGRRRQGRRHQAAPARRPEVPAARNVGRSPRLGEIPARSPGGLGSESSQYLHHLRHRRASRPALHRHGTVGGRDAETPARGKALADRSVARSGRPDRRRARRRRREGDHPSGHQAGQHLRHRPGPGQAARFRTGQGGLPSPSGRGAGRARRRSPR